MKPNVKLINVSDNRESAWVFSRPTFDHSDLDMGEIGSMDMSLNSLCMITFEVQSSLLFRDWMFGIRPIFPWARSSRSTPLSADNTQISAEFGMNGMLDVEKVIDLIKSGVPQDQAREGLPMTMSTAFTVTMDLRTCVGMIKTMKVLCNDMYYIYGLLFEDAIKGIKGASNSKVREFSDSYLLGQEEFNLRKASKNGSQIHGVYEMKSALMAQFLRTSHATVKTELWNDISGFGYMSLGDLKQDTMFRVSFYMEDDAYGKLMSLRSHWFADWSDDMWGTMVGDYVCDMSTEEFWNFIPNGAGKDDPYYRDMISRINGEEHNLPCPIMIEDPSMIYKRLETQGDNRVIGKYIDLVDEEYIRDNDKNAMRIQYANRNK